MNELSIRFFLLYAIELIFLSCSILTHAATETMNINISGAVVSNTICTFNNGSPLTIDFGSVSLDNKAGAMQISGEYIQDIASAFSCNGDVTGLLQLKVSSSKGIYVTVDTINDTLTTSKDGLGIQLLWNGIPQSMDTWVSVTPQNQPVIQARLRQTGGISNTVSGEEFTATGAIILAFN